jgi:hypothetical protein
MIMIMQCYLPQISKAAVTLTNLAELLCVISHEAPQ